MCANKNDQSTFDNVLEYQTYESKIDEKINVGFREKNEGKTLQFTCLFDML